ncbi:MAG: 50S ribosomal protein L32 [Epulopiscium sp.]|nr:50S ribosomal protein L32 [Candidatus Epulonipiscium sp.]
MMAVPKRKTSKAKRNQRRANWKLTTPNLSKCSKCGELMMPHRVCKACGTYNKKVVVEAE